ncbi:COP9 signalosome complex subunit 6a [Populus alba x Populus x berolinensis]|uniref:COP9 signalosome complex subunit 6a n=1 Tax=Populus alba x Populus x berolinensis TaxID=444605 RepID=A0AAD6M4C1_9ROSI|nr:COP9 signalosome complex subunit 6a [Populus alba x Populus x berolinensis]
MLRESDMHIHKASCMSSMEFHNLFLFVQVTPLRRWKLNGYSVDHVAHLKPSDGGSAATQLAAHLTGIHSAIKMLNSRIRVLHHYLVAMQKGEIPCENSLLRQVSSLLRRLPAIESEKFQDDFLMEYNDTLLIAYLAMFTNCSSTMNELVDKFNTAYDRHSRRGGRTAFI